MKYFSNLVKAWRGWQNRVESVSDLPPSGILGEVRLVLDEKTLYFWNGTAWEATAGGGGGGSSNSFTTIQTDAGTSPVATSSNDTLTLTSSDGSVIITGDSSSDEVDLQADPDFIKSTAVQDTIVDGVEDIAPSQNAVYDALQLKQDSLTADQIDSFDENFDEMTKEFTNLDTGVFKTITWKTAGGTTRKTSVLSGGTAPEFTTRTETIYETDGVTVRRTNVYTLSYSSGRLTGESL